MPDDAIDIDLSEEQREWTLRILQCLGLRPNEAGAEEDLENWGDVDLIEVYADRIDARKSAAGKIAGEKARLSELERDVEAATGEAKLLLEREIRTQNELIATHEAQFVAIGSAERALFNLLKVDHETDEQFADAQNALSDYQRMDVHDERPSSLHKDLEGTEDEVFAEAASNTMARIAKARDVSTFTVNYTIDLEDGIVGESAQTFPLISTSEANVLEKMVGVAEAAYEKLGFDVGMNKLEEADAQLGRYIAAREGLHHVEKPGGLDDRVDRPLDVIAGWAEKLRELGYVEISDDMANKARTIEHEFQSNFGNDGFDIEPLVARADDLLKSAYETKGKVDEIEEIVRKAGWLKRSIEQSGTDDDIDSAEEIMAGFDRRGLVPTCRNSAGFTLTQMELLVESVKQARTKAENTDFDLNAERARIEALEARYEDLFKHNKRGKTRMIEDSATGEMKGAKKNSALPREVIRDLEVSIQKAKLRLESGAAEVAVGACTDIEALEKAFDTLDERPKLYKDLHKNFVNAEKELAKLDKKEAVYCTQERARLKIELDGLKKREKDIDTSAVSTALQAFNEKIEAHKADIRDLKYEITRFNGHIKALREKLKQIATLSKSVRHLTGQPTVNSDFGTQASALDEIEAILAKPDPNKMKDVPGRLAVISAELSEILAAFEAVKTEAEGNGNKLPKLSRSKRKAEKDRRVAAATSLDQFKVVDDFMKQSGAAKRAYDDNMARKSEFEEGAARLLNGVKAAKKRLQKLDRNADFSTVDALVSEVEGLKTEMKNSREYIDGCAQLRALRDRFRTAMQEIKQRIDLGEEKLVDLAVRVVDSVRSLDRAIGAITTKIEQAAGIDYAADGPYDRKKIEAFLDATRSFLTALPATDMAKATAALDKKENDISVRKKARAEALRVVRQIKELSSNSARLKHIAEQSFEPTVQKTLKTLRLQTSILEVKLLTALGKET